VPLPFTGEGDHAQRGGGGCPTLDRRKVLPASVGFAATFPRKREKESRLPLP